jgi:hypothetical protein
MGHPKLEDLDGFSRIAAIPGDLVIYETSLESLGALSNIRSVGLNCVVRISLALTAGRRAAPAVRLVSAPVNSALNEAASH